MYIFYGGMIAAWLQLHYPNAIDGVISGKTTYPSICMYVCMFIYISIDMFVCVYIYVYV